MEYAILSFPVGEKTYSWLFHAILSLVVIAASYKKAESTDYIPIGKKIIEDYLTVHNDSMAQSTASGVYYIIQRPCETIHPTRYSSVTVNYQGFLTDGTHFDSSPSGKPFTRPLSSLITGWQVGLQLIGTGGKITLFCPSALGYGSYEVGSIPANLLLTFTVGLIKFN